MIRKVKGKLVDKDKLENRRQYVEGEIDGTLVEIEQKLIEARVRFKELIKKGAEIREKELLEYYNAELLNSTEKEKKI